MATGTSLFLVIFITLFSSVSHLKLDVLSEVSYSDDYYSMRESKLPPISEMILTVGLSVGVLWAYNATVGDEGSSSARIHVPDIDVHAPSDAVVEALKISPETETIIIDAFDTTVAYWKEKGVQLDTSFTLLGMENATTCGGDTRFGRDAAALFYCPLDDRVVVSEAFGGLVEIIEPTDAGQQGMIETVIAHEVGHAVQYASMTAKSKLAEPQNIILKELQADCLSGQALQGAPSEQIDGGENFFRFLTSDMDFTHGTRAQRLAAFSLGNEGDLCTLSAVRAAVQE